MTPARKKPILGKSERRSIVVHASTQFEDSRTLAVRLERGEVIYYPICPFPLPSDEDLEFLRRDIQLGGSVHKNVSYKPLKNKLGGTGRLSASIKERLRLTLCDFATKATDWLTTAIPEYADGWRRDMVSYRPLEEATRSLRLTARNDLLHVDAFPTRPTNGWRILRVFVNINPSEPRVWVTSDPFARLLEKYGEKAGLPRADMPLLTRIVQTVPRLFRESVLRRPEYDHFMHRFHNYLKRNEVFQEKTTKRVWHFPPFSVWMTMTDTCSHSVLRGRFALEHSYFINPATLVLPDESPAALLEKMCGQSLLRRAA